jgi:PAS domain S-box-containing protein
MPSVSRKNQKEVSSLDAFFKNATLGIVVTDSEGKIAAINPLALKEFGFAKKEILGKPVDTIIPRQPGKNNMLQEAPGRLKIKKLPLGGDGHLVAKRKDGSEFFVEVGLSIYNTDGQKYVISFINNISARKKAEMAFGLLKDELERQVVKCTRDLKATLHRLEITNIQLEAAVAFQKAVLNNAGVMIIATNKKGIIQLFNPEAVLNTGYTETEVINKEQPVILHDKKEVQQKRAELLKEFGVIIKDDFKVLVEKATRNIHAEEQYTFIRKDGSAFPVTLTITTMKDRAGFITGCMAIAIDISERKQAEENLIGALKKEKELNELKSAFVSMASHEFRTPLSAISSSAYLIKNYTTTADQPKRAKHLGRISSAVDTLNSILNDFLNAGKIEAGKTSVRFTEFDINQLLTDTITELKNGLNQDYSLHYFHKGAKNVLLDQSLLKHIIINLVSNARKFSGGEHPIEIKTINLRQTISLSVKDQGIGIPREDQQHLGTLFFRGSNAGNIQGTGLGLHIVCRYAALMHGKMVCKSREEKGTEFIITFKKQEEQV